MRVRFWVGVYSLPHLPTTLWVGVAQPKAGFTAYCISSDAVLGRCIQLTAFPPTTLWVGVAQPKAGFTAYCVSPDGVSPSSRQFAFSLCEQVVPSGGD